MVIRIIEGIINLLMFSVLNKKTNKKMYDMASSMVEVCNILPKKSCMNVMLLTASHRAVIVILGDDRHHSSVLVLLLSPSQPPSPPEVWVGLTAPALTSALVTMVVCSSPG